MNTETMPSSAFARSFVFRGTDVSGHHVDEKIKYTRGESRLAEWGLTYYMAGNTLKQSRQYCQ